MTIGCFFTYLLEIKILKSFLEKHLHFACFGDILYQLPTNRRKTMEDMEQYINECEELLEDTIGSLARIADEHKAMEAELAEEFIKRIKEHFHIEHAI